MKSFSIIVAIDKKNGFAKNNKIPWYLKKDLKYFNSITTGGVLDKNNVIIMGRKTWESLPVRPLPNRINIVISSDSVYKSLNSALIDLNKPHKKYLINDIFVVGGQQLYEEAIEHPLCEKLYITYVDRDFECDRFFPQIDTNKWKLSDCSCINEENGIKYMFCIYEKKTIITGGYNHPL